VKINYPGLGYLLLAVVSGVFYGFGGTILKKGVDFHWNGNVLDLLRQAVAQKFLLVSLACSAAGYLLYVVIIRKAEVVTTTLIIQGVLFFSTILFAHWIFREAVTGSKLLALALILSGIAVLLLGK